VDSSAAAALMVSQGHNVIGMTMRLYDAKGTTASSGRCCGPRDIEDARRVSEHLEIPFYVVDFAEEFSRRVVDDFVESYLQGETPNPCVKCNQFIKFTPLLARARALGAETVVTGHYARLQERGGQMALCRGVDDEKDQSYFLFSMPREALPRVQFPLGSMTKEAVRALAEEHRLPNAAKPESQEICFVPDGDYAGFVERSALVRGRSGKLRKGNIVDEAGAILGEHDGVHRFTVGQRRGLGNLKYSESPRYVTRVDAGENRVVVGGRRAAEQSKFAVRDTRWLVDERPASAEVQIRYRSRPVRAALTTSEGRCHVTLETPMVFAPGQAAVFYDGDTVLGGGWIAEAAQ